MFRHRQFLQLLQAFEDGSVLQQKQAIQDCLPNLESLLVFKVCCAYPVADVGCPAQLFLL